MLEFMWVYVRVYIDMYVCVFFICVSVRVWACICVCVESTTYVLANHHVLKAIKNTMFPGCLIYEFLTIHTWILVVRPFPPQFTTSMRWLVTVTLVARLCPSLSGLLHTFTVTGISFNTEHIVKTSNLAWGLYTWCLNTAHTFNM